MKNLTKLIQANFDEMSKKHLFRVKLSGQEIWDLYLKSFSKKNDPVFRDPNSTEHNCNLCNNFIRRYGNIVSINEDFTLKSIFNVELEEGTEYYDSMKAMTKAIESSEIQDVFFETFDELNFLPYESCSKTQDLYKLGVNKNVKRYTKEEAELYGVVKPDEIREFHHFNLLLNTKFVDKTGKSVESIMGEYRDNKNVFKRGLDEISLDTLELVRDLINQDSILDGKTHLEKVEKFITFKKDYDKIQEKDNWAWVNSYGLFIAKFRNELIGVLCSDLSQGVELNKACQDWNKRVDPTNYMKATAPITKKQIEEAKKFVQENGYEESFERRMATIDDIKVSEILHSNVGDSKIKEVSIFDSVKSTATRHKKSEFEGLQEISIDKFMTDILPNCTSIEAYLKNNHEGNMVSLTTAAEDSKPIFKWDNNYSWTFNGDIAGKSQIKEAVKTAGGNVSGVLRCSMIWNEGTTDNSDLDLWCQQPDGTRIGFSSGYRADSSNLFTNLGGQLDLDNTSPGGKLAIENIYFVDRKKLKDGTYRFWVNQYYARGSKGFKVEIEFDGEIYTYEYNTPLRTGENVNIAEVRFKNGEFSINHNLPSNEVSKEIYGLETNQFHKVELLCLSPNHWGKNKVGNKHFFFMLKNCKAPSSIRGFHNENLISDLAKHRKVLEVLGAQKRVESSKKQLSGLGFNATIRDELILKLSGSFKRMVKIKF